ncbi:MAG: prepilin-type N-terminal cleavage/methylation domain-containing protein [Clostridiales bacterium]|nr:prepilin-type N-terminal cleavage/methylation domain-containing protein [Clostridiales bacterium]
MKNNKGFSLIELIVTIAILALFSTGVLAGLGYLEMANSQKCVAKIDSGLMTLKSRNMANSNRTYMHIYQYNDGKYYLAFSEAADYDEACNFNPKGTDDVIGNRKLKISYLGKEIGLNECIHIGINKKDGSFDEKPHLSALSTITVEGSTTHSINLVTATGKYYKE